MQHQNIINKGRAVVHVSGVKAQRAHCGWSEPHPYTLCEAGKAHRQGSVNVIETYSFNLLTYFGVVHVLIVLFSINFINRKIAIYV